MNTIPGCVGCRWAKWDMNGRRRLTKQTNGECLWPVPELPAVPMVYEVEIRPHSAIWPALTGICPVREEA